MGCDIHGVLQSKRQGKYVSIADMDLSRNYRLFAVLAGVRNGTGFAGVATHAPIQPISEPRGLPEDFLLNKSDEAPIEFSDKAVWMGDHSHSWLTVSEVQAWPHWDQHLSETGVITLEQFKAWDGTAPKEWSGDVCGPNIKLCTPDNLAGATHVRVEWSDRVLRQVCREFFAWLEYAQSRHYGRPDDRIVFGFDS